MNDSPKVRSTSGVDRTLSVLEAFLVRPAWRLSDLSRHLEIGKASVYRILRALEIRGYIEQDGAGGMYLLGPSVALLGSAASGQNRVDLDRSHLLRLAQQSGEVVLTYVLRGHRYLCTDRVSLNSTVPVTVEIGDTIGLHAGAGKSILAFQSEDFIRKVLSSPLSKYSDSTPLDPLAVRKMLDTIVKQEYWISYGEITPNTIGISAPIRSATGAVDRAICITVSSNHVSDKRVDYLVECVADAASSISQSFGYKTTPTQLATGEAK